MKSPERPSCAALHAAVTVAGRRHAVARSRRWSEHQLDHQLQQLTVGELPELNWCCATQPHFPEKQIADRVAAPHDGGAAARAGVAVAAPRDGGPATPDPAAVLPDDAANWCIAAPDDVVAV